ncbi:hypothetical protein CROQUDRAFT_654207 [Cronartium quercuum f. sp. fusiforme G11]|uniref:Transfer RNA methyltransferase 82 n=1 Tax=Cronartium quercuum f. sp. fusiforme G11 TaxID=708437 RepID=A0A9P6NST1_9BASI|nr:hypothetical protein CROQUDRAFT_654207 [Cronartium quercuum f. sp. fusiforme G11]
MRLPCQRLVKSADRKLLVIASGAHLQVADLGTGQILSSRPAALAPDPTGSHFGLIRLLVIHQHAATSDGPNRTVLISTGEDKMLKTWDLPTLNLLQSRELAKRATALSVSPNGKHIVIGDKSGDIYNLPFDAPDNLVFASDPDHELKDKPNESLGSQQAESSSKPVILAPIAGHVSILTSLTFIPSRPNPYLITADRDEHIRISRYPKAWSIENYLLGHQRFVGALLWVPGFGEQGGVVLSGGGEDDVFVWDPSQATCRQKISVKGLSSGLKVQPEKEAWFMKTRNNQKRQKPGLENEEAVKGDGTQTGDQLTNNLPKSAQTITLSETGKGRTIPLPAICINRMICTVSENIKDERYVVISSAGSSIVAVLSVSSLLAPTREIEGQARYYDFQLPVLDLIDTSNHELLVSVDTSANSQDPNPNPRTALKGLVIKKDKIFESQSILPALSELNANCSIEESTTNPMPTTGGLYSELLLFHKGHLEDRQDKRQARDPDQSPPMKKNRQAPMNGKAKKQEGRLLSSQRVENLLKAKTD